ncbi:hypothetical protein M0R45_033970 [Rubus argutus]|uniref:Laccase n=1 Tax=Rubus argutus TaxID=59490 RepID=A0AAW1VRV0_RUBAR
MGLGLLWFLFAQALVLQICLAQDGTVHNLHFVVDEVNITRMCTAQLLLTVNGSFPGPNITVTRGDTAIVSVQNNGEHPLTIHWHGVKQHRNPWSDGPENITQTPIQGGGGTFTYTIIFSDEEGTLWWHAHSDWTRASIYGAIIVLPPNEVYPFDTKPDHTQTIILGSWFKGRDLMKEYLDAQRTGGDVDISDSFTINGYTGRNDTGCDLKDDIYTLKVERDKTYHLRIINAAMNEEMFFAISGHSFRVVGLDGAYLTPLLTNYIMITPGQTMDILLTANQTAGSYYMGGSAFADSFANSYDKSTTRAFLNYTDYNGTLVQDSLADLLAAPSNRSYADAFTKQLRGLKDNNDYPIKVPGHFDINKKFIITISTNTLPCDLDPQVENCTGPPLDGSRGMHSATLNNVRFRTKEIDILRAYYCNISGVYTEDFPHKPADFNYTGDDTGDAEEEPIQGTRVISVQYGDAVEIVFQGTSVGNPENHPMHVHGYNFYLVGSDDGNFNSSSPNSYNLVDPPEVNTFGVPKKGWAAFRFWANNPGVWFLHCHLERHASWGMAGVLIVHNVTSDQDGILDPPAGYPKCSEPYPYL